MSFDGRCDNTGVPAHGMRVLEMPEGAEAREWSTCSGCSTDHRMTHAVLCSGVKDNTGSAWTFCSRKCAVRWMRAERHAKLVRRFEEHLRRRGGEHWATRVLRQRERTA